MTFCGLRYWGYGYRIALPRQGAGIPEMGYDTDIEAAVIPLKRKVTLGSNISVKYWVYIGDMLGKYWVYIPKSFRMFNTIMLQWI